MICIERKDWHLKGAVKFLGALPAADTSVAKQIMSLPGKLVSYFIRGFNQITESKADENSDALISGYTVPQRECTVLSERRPVGILYADIAEYARLTEEDEVGTHLRLVEIMDILKSSITARNGRVAHTAGDAILAEFKDAESALYCAINVQLAGRQWNTNLNLHHQVRFRIGVNFGEVITRDGDIFGKAVNLAARLESLADSGGICVSDVVRSELETSPAFNFVPMGKRRLKNIDEPVEVFWIEFDAVEINKSSCDGNRCQRAFIS